MPRRRIAAGRDESARSRTRRITSGTTARISKVAKAAPRQRRMPPPKGSQAKLSTRESTKRSGAEARGLGVGGGAAVGEHDVRRDVPPRRQPPAAELERLGEAP